MPGRFVFSICFPGFSGIGSGEYGSWRWSGDELCQLSQVLDGSDKMELIAGAGQTSPSESGQSEVPLHIAEPGLDPFAFPGGATIGLGVHQGADVVARRFMYVARKISARRVRAALRF